MSSTALNQNVKRSSKSFQNIRHQSFGNFTCYSLVDFPVPHGFFTRAGGLSQAPYTSLNTAFKTADPASADNRNLLLQTIGLEAHSVYVLNPCHGETIAQIMDSAKRLYRSRNDGEKGGQQILRLTEAAVTACPDTWFLISSADCPILLLTDKNRSFIGVAHFGWKNIVAEFVRKVMTVITRGYCSNIQDIIIGISPCIYPCCYIFESPVQMNIPFWKPFLRDLGHKRYAIDLVSALKTQLINWGILPENIRETQICTGCHTDSFFSVYREGYLTGRFPSLIGLGELPLKLLNS